MNLANALDQFIVDCEFNDLSPATVVWYRKMIGAFVRIQPGALEAVTRADIKSFLHAQKSRGLQPESVRGFVRALRRFFNWAVEEELIETSPAHVKVPKRRRQMPRTISLSDVQRLLATCDDDASGVRDRAIIWLLYDTGCRVGGLLGLTLSDVDFDRRAVLVREKDGFRYSPILPETVDVLKAWLAVRPKDEPSDAVFVGLGNGGGALQYDGLRTMLKRRGARGGCEGPVNPHAFRHAFAKEYILSGGDQFTLADLLGHKDPAMTKEYYAVFAFEELKKPHDKYSPARKLL